MPTQKTIADNAPVCNFDPIKRNASIKYLVHLQVSQWKICTFGNFFNPPRTPDEGDCSDNCQKMNVL